MSAPAESTQVKIYLLLARRLYLPFKPLSLNILREVCMYLGTEQHFVPAISTTIYTVYDLKQRCMRTVVLSRSFTSGAVFCFVGGDTLMCVGGFPPENCAFFIKNQEMTALESMQTARAWPGIFHNHHTVYLFGGNYPQIRSCEKFSLATKHWSALPDMAYERYSFTPCLWKQELMLVDGYPGHKVVEAFCLIAETFRVLDVKIPTELCCNSLSFIQSDKLVLLADGNSYGIWQLGSNTIEIKPLKKHSRAYSPTLPVLYNDLVYYSLFEHGELVYFDPAEDSIVPVTDFKNAC